MKLFTSIEQFVSDSFTAARNPADLSHHQRTVYWMKQLKPDAGEALLIAGMAHDIERAFYGDWKAGSSDPEKLKRHQELSAGIIETFLKKQNAPHELIARVKNLVLHHEEGGNEEQAILCDADCLAYLEEKAVRNAKHYKQEGKVEEGKKKLE